MHFSKNSELLGNVNVIRGREDDAPEYYGYFVTYLQSMVSQTNPFPSEVGPWGIANMGRSVFHSMDEAGIEPSENSTKEKVGFVTMLIGFGVALVGVVLSFDSYVGSQMAGAFLLLVGLLIASAGLKLNGNDKIGTRFLFFPLFSSMKVRLFWMVFVTISFLAYYVYEGAI